MKHQRPKIRDIQPIQLKKEFILERKAEKTIKKIKRIEFNDSPNHFFTPISSYKSTKQQNLLRLTLENGIFYRANGKKANGEYLYITDKDFNFIASKEKNIHHSYLSKGKEVRGAGTVIFKKGQLVQIDNNSGHYRPKLHEMIPLLSFLKQNLNYIDKVKFISYSEIAKQALYKLNASKLVSYYSKHGFYHLYKRRNKVETIGHPLKKANSDRIELHYSRVQELLLFAQSSSEMQIWREVHHSSRESYDSDHDSNSGIDSSDKFENITIGYVTGL